MKGAACGKKKAGVSMKLCTMSKLVNDCDVAWQQRHCKDHPKESERMALVSKAREEATAGLQSLSIFSPIVGLNDPNPDIWKTPPRPECPICMLPLPLIPEESVYMMCCGKLICGGCILKNRETIRENRVANRKSSTLEEICAFCREGAPSKKKEVLRMLKKRMEMNDSGAFFCASGYFSDGVNVRKDDRKVLEYLLRSVELGNASAPFLLADYYELGKYVDADKAKRKEYLQLAVMRGNVCARHALGNAENENSRGDLAVRHWRIAAATGLEASLRNVKAAYKHGLVRKEEFAETLRAYQAAQEDLKSEERDRFAKLRAENGGGRDILEKCALQIL